MEEAKKDLAIWKMLLHACDQIKQLLRVPRLYLDKQLIILLLHPSSLEM